MSTPEDESSADPIIRGSSSSIDRPAPVRTGMPRSGESEYGNDADDATAGPGSGPEVTGAGATYTGTMPDDPEQAKHYRPDQPQETPYAEDQSQFEGREQD